jgi:hypothetical protein
VRHPRREADERLGGAYDARVLEPSPPAVTRAPWFADDPVDAEGDGRPVASPVAGRGAVTWDELAAEDPALAEFCAERWLGGWRPLEPAPEPLGPTLRAYDLIAEHVLSPTRQRANGQSGLRWVLGGLGTPYFGNDAQLRLVGSAIELQIAAGVRWVEATSLQAAAELVGFELTRFDQALVAAPLEIDRRAARWIADVLGFGTSVLEEVRARVGAQDRVEVRTGPLRVELAAGTTIARVALGEPGGEPGVVVQAAASAAPHATLPISTLVGAPDARSTALAFIGEHGP